MTCEYCGESRGGDAQTHNLCMCVTCPVCDEFVCEMFAKDEQEKSEKHMLIHYKFAKTANVYGEECLWCEAPEIVLWCDPCNQEADENGLCLECYRPRTDVFCQNCGVLTREDGTIEYS